MKNEIIATESFSHYQRHYFFDFMEAANHTKYIRFVCSEQQADGSYQRCAFRVFEEQFGFLIEALSSLFSMAAYQTELKEKARPDEERTTGIKSWEAECRPREKLMAQGRAALSDAELLAMLIGSGGLPGLTAVDLGEKILLSVGHDLRKLSQRGIEELTRFRGMGVAKSLSIISAMELAARLAERQHAPVWLKAVRG